MGLLHKNLQLMLEFFKVPFLFAHFSYYTLMTFQKMVLVILRSMVIILPSMGSVIRCMICGNNQSCLLNLNLTY